ncbi:MAG TPA: hypothetical protein VLR46_07120 [Candidatus Dormibacteraeota bacterium]|nr:hypothetical protein [Candidatus Dormibacteraeota bacterium]
MALTQKKLQDLKDSSLVDLLENDQTLWRAKAKLAYNATRGFIREIRPDDVVSLLVAELEVAPELRTYLAKKKLTQKYWYPWFAELIIDRFWTELTGG